DHRHVADVLTDVLRALGRRRRCQCLAHTLEIRRTRRPVVAHFLDYLARERRYCALVVCERIVDARARVPRIRDGIAIPPVLLLARRLFVSLGVRVPPICAHGLTLTEPSGAMNRVPLGNASSSCGELTRTGSPDVAPNSSS